MSRTQEFSLGDPHSLILYKKETVLIFDMNTRLFFMQVCSEN